MVSPQSVRAKAFTSVANLGYGFDVLGLCVTAGFDEVSIEPGHRGLEIIVDGEHGGEVPSDPAKNTAGVAVAAMMRRHGVNEAVRLRVTKGIRCGSGLGSSAASAAAAVTAANAFFALGCTPAELVTFAAEGETASAGAAHADNVAASILGGLVICVPPPTMDGSRNGAAVDCPEIMSVKVPADLRIVVALPDVRVPTREARAALPREISLARYSEGCAHCAMIVAAAMSGDVRAFGRAVEGSFVDQSRSAFIPGFEVVRDRAKRAGAVGVTVGGAGPAVAAIVDPNADAQRVADAMREGFNKAGVAGARAADVCVTRVGPPARVLDGDR